MKVFPGGNPEYARLFAKVLSVGVCATCGRDIIKFSDSADWCAPYNGYWCENNVRSRHNPQTKNMYLKHYFYGTV
jgi:hypothetical protein